MESVIERFFAYEFGEGSGEGFSGGNSEGCGKGEGNSTGFPYPSNGFAYIYQRGGGTGSGCGDYKGCGDGGGDNPGRGLNGGIKSINGMPMYCVRGRPTIITSVHDDYAKGYIVEDTCSLRPCYIAKDHGHFAHGDTLREAREAAEAAYEAELREEEDDETHDVKVVEETELEATGTINGHDYVDLGLSVKWATCNVGASSPEDYGQYFAWGEISTKSAYNEDNSMVLTDKDFDEYICGNPAFDAARANWGGTWRLPTEEEMEELVCNCTWIWATLHDWEGYKVTGPNGRSIFLPAAGCRIKTKYWFSCESGCYWTATPQGYFNCAFFLGFDSEQHIVDYEQSHCGLSVRAVAE